VPSDCDANDTRCPSDKASLTAAVYSLRTLGDGPMDFGREVNSECMRKSCVKFALPLCAQPLDRGIHELRERIGQVCSNSILRTAPLESQTSEPNITRRILQLIIPRSTRGCTPEGNECRVITRLFIQLERSLYFLVKICHKLDSGVWMNYWTDGDIWYSPSQPQADEEMEESAVHQWNGNRTEA
jgi:hypothetical protein